MPAGRPPLFDTPEQLQAAIIEYFKEAADTGTVTGLALYLGFCDRQSLYDYEEKPEYSCIIKEARLRVENCYEKKLHGSTPTGSIFALKNMGWKDRTEVAAEIKKYGDLSKLTDEELLLYAELQSKVSGE